MATWDSGKCGYCGHTEADLEKYECPECKRAGCSSCMPEVGETPCSDCVTKAEWLEKQGLEGLRS